MAGSTRIDFFSNAAAGNSTDFAVQQAGSWMFYAEATFGGGTVKLQFQSPHGTWIDFPSGSLSANGALILQLPQGRYRAVGTTASAIYSSMVTVPTQTNR